MNIVGISACSAGIAHTYIVQEKLEQVARKMGHTCKIETQGSIGVENELTPADIEAADVVLLAVDIKVGGMDRFKGKPVVKVSTEVATKNPAGLIKSIEKKLAKGAEA